MSSPTEHKAFPKWEKKEKKDYHRGYQVFEADSTPEKEEVTSPKPSKSRTKPSFKLPKKDKIVSKGNEKEAKRDKKKERKKIHRKKQQMAYNSQSAETPQRPVFGVPLELAVQRSKSHDGLQIPAFFRECVDYVEAHGLSTEGIYRISPVKSKVQSLVHAINMGRQVDFTDYDPCVIAGVIKLYLRELPEPVLTSTLGLNFEEASALRDPQTKLRAFKQLLEMLPTSNKLLLAWMIIHATHVISRASENKMTLQNVSIVLSPTMQISHRVLNIFLTYHNDLFSDICYKRYIPPLKPASDGSRVELPDTAAAVEEELAKQESLLNTLHEEIKEGDTNEEKEAQIWEVQRFCTQLKRKRFLLVRLVSREAIEAELSKQEAQLARLHEQIERAEGADQEADDQLWEVQRTVTMLKRKLKAAQRSAAAQAAAAGGAGGGQAAPPPAAPGAAQGSVPPAPGVAAAPGPGDRQKGDGQPSTAEEEEDVMLNLTLRKVDTEVEAPAPVPMPMPMPAAQFPAKARGPGFDHEREEPPPAPKEAAVDAPALEEWKEEEREEVAPAAAVGESQEQQQQQPAVTEPQQQQQEQEQEQQELPEEEETTTEGEAPAEVAAPEPEPEPEPEPDEAAVPRRLSAAATTTSTEGPPRISDSSSRSSSSVVAHSSAVDEEEDEDDPELEACQQAGEALRGEKLGEHANGERRGSASATTGGPGGASGRRFMPGPMISLDDFIERGFLAAGECDLLLGDEDEDEELRAALDDYRRLRYEEEELCAIHNDLLTRIESERREIVRLQQEVNRLKLETGAGNEGSSGGDLSSDEYDSSEEEAPEEELMKQYYQLKQDNERLSRENQAQVENIQRERMLCAEIKVQLRMMTSSSQV